jgi:hypothetical protein
MFMHTRSIKSRDGDQTFGENWRAARSGVPTARSLQRVCETAAAEELERRSSLAAVNTVYWQTITMFKRRRTTER